MPETESSAARIRVSNGWQGTLKLAPGLVLATLVAVGALLVAQILPATLGPVLMAVVLGMIIGNAATLPEATKAGIGFAAKKLLRLGVILLGARLTFGDIVEVGGVAVGVVVLGMTVAFLTVAAASKLVGISPRLATLIGVGTAVCGNSAIMATAPIIDAEDREISFSVATITIFGTFALLLFPLIGHALDLPDRVFGFWAGLSINDTAQVVAAGAAYSNEALDVAAIVKLVRNALMAPLILIIAWWAARQEATKPGADVRGSALKAFPLFVLGFLALATAQSFGVFPEEVVETLSFGSTLFITIAIGAVGLSTKIADLRRVGIKPFVVGLGAATALALVGFWLATLLG